MPAHWRRGLAFFFFLVLVTGLLSQYSWRAQAALSIQDTPQQNSQIRLYPLDSSAFPQVTTYLDVFDSAGNFYHDLMPQEVQVVENNQPLPVIDLQELHPGVQFALVITYGPALGIRDGMGRSRYDYLLEDIQGWEWASDLAYPDDLSLVLDGGPQAVHLSRPGDLVTTLLSFVVDPREATPSLQPLSNALNVVMDPADRFGMDRVVLFITPSQSPEAIVGLQNLAAQAVQAGIRIFIWLVAAPEEVELPSAVQLQNLAEQTGGEFFNYSGTEPVPQIETYLAPLRHIYQLRYNSQITSSGVYTVTANLQHGEFQLASEPQSLEISLQPANIIFVGLPAQITRQIPTPQAESTQTAAEEKTTSLQPSRQELEVMVEFPDGHSRPLEASALLVDGTTVAQNLAEPFNQFTWDLDPYTESAFHRVQVVVTDTLGLRGSSLEMPVEILVNSPSNRLKNLFPERGLWFAGLLLLMLAGVAILILVISGRLRPNRFRWSSAPRTRPSPSLRRSTRQKAARTLSEAPAEPAAQTASAHPGWKTRFSRSSQPPRRQAEAYLMPITEAETSNPEAPVAITSDEIIFGNDPQQCTWTIHNPALDPVHARLRREDDIYVLYDEGSTAGTWLNYMPVPAEGARLHHGDLVHIGQIGFRFTSRNPKDMRKPIIINLE